MAIVFKNLMETIVLNKLDEMGDELECCHCERCRLDIASYVLNKLPSKYVVTSEGQLLSKLESFHPQNNVDIISLLVQAAKLINEHPRH